MKFSNFVSSILTAAVVNNNSDGPVVCRERNQCPEGFEKREVNGVAICLNCDLFESDGSERFVCTKQTQSITVLVGVQSLSFCGFHSDALNRGIPAACFQDCPLGVSTTVLPGFPSYQPLCYNCDELQLDEGVMTCKKFGQTRKYIVNATSTCHNRGEVGIPTEPSPLERPTLFLAKTCYTGYQSVRLFQPMASWVVCHNCESFQSDQGQITCKFKGQIFPFAERLLPISKSLRYYPDLEAELPVCRTRQVCRADAFSMELGDTSVCFNCTNADLNVTTFSCTVEGGKRFTSQVSEIRACYKPRSLPPIREKEAAVCIGDYECPEGLQPDKEGRSPICHNCDAFVQEGQLGSISGWFNCTRDQRESTFQQIGDCFDFVKPSEALRQSSPALVCAEEKLYDCPLFASSLHHEAWPDTIGCHNCDSIVRTEIGVECFKDGKQETFENFQLCYEYDHVTRAPTRGPTIAPTDSIPGTNKPTIAPTNFIPRTRTPTSSPSLLPTEDSRASRPTPSNIPSAATASVCSSFFLLVIPFLYFL